MSQKNWSDIVSWTHSWDMIDMVGYEDDGESWTIRPQRRVESVADRGAAVNRLTGTCERTTVAGHETAAAAGRSDGRRA